MLIKKIHLKNIKKYDEIEYSFTQGTQLILGPNGSGKSTIIEAIGWVLFDHLDYKLSNWTKWGKDYGSVKVTILDNENDIEYEVFRDTGGKYIISHSGNSELASGIQDVQFHIKKLFKINDDASKVFKDIIGVSQELMASQFSLTPSYKKKIFDPLLGIEKFSRMWNYLKPVESFLSSDINQLKVNEASIKGWIESASSTKDEHASKFSELEKLMDSTSKLELDFKKINDELTRLSNIKIKYDESEIIKNKIKILEGRLGDVKVREKEILEMEKEMNILKPSADKQLNIMNKLDEMKEIEREMKSLSNEHSRLTGEYETLRDSIEYAEEQYKTNFEKINRESKDFKIIEEDFRAMEEQRIKIESEMAELDRQAALAQEGKCPITGDNCPINVYNEVLKKKTKAEDFMENVFYKDYVKVKQKLGQSKNAKINLENLIRMKEQAEKDLEKIGDIVNSINEIVNSMNKYNEILSNKPRIIKINNELGNALERYKELEVMIKNSRVKSVKEDVEKEISDLSTKLSNLDSDSFDHTIYDSTKDDFSKMKTLLEENKRRKGELDLEVNKLKNKLKELNEKEEELSSILDKIGVLNKRYELVKSTRDKLRDIPPYIAKGLLIAINNTANRYHNEIAGACTLEIDENYDVLLSDDKGTRGFRNLSGGEKMTTSVAIRLAFLNEITNIKFLALDEPTASVDSNRKQLLSDIISKIKGVDQLFVISHDDVFISQSNNIVEVEP